MEYNVYLKVKLLLKISTLTAILPMIIGSLIFCVWFCYPNHEIELFGLWTIAISIPVCIIGLTITVIFILKNKIEVRIKKKGYRNIFLILINIPLAIFYIWFVMYLLSTERITIINNTKNDITNINIFGVGNNDCISIIPKGGSKTIWVHITKESAIKIFYKAIGKDYNETIDGYIGSNMGGHRYDHYIN